MPHQLLHQRTDLVRDRRPSRCVRIGPFPLDQVPVPGQQRARGHDPVQPQVPGQQPRQGGDHGTISPARPRARDLTAQHRDLMPEHKDLRLLSGAAPRRSTSQPNTRTMKR